MQLTHNLETKKGHAEHHTKGGERHSEERHGRHYEECCSHARKKLCYNVTWVLQWRSDMIHQNRDLEAMWDRKGRRRSLTHNLMLWNTVLTTLLWSELLGTYCCVVKKKKHQLIATSCFYLLYSYVPMNLLSFDLNIWDFVYFVFVGISDFVVWIGFYITCIGFLLYIPW